MDLENFGIVEKNEIYRCGIIDKVNFYELLDAKVKSVICLKTNIFEVSNERSMCKTYGIQFRHLPINLVLFTPHEKEKFLFAYNYMCDLPKPLIFHCTKGADRTGLLCALWRKRRNGWNDVEIEKELEKFGFNPIFSFWKNYLLREFIW